MPCTAVWGRTWASSSRCCACASLAHHSAPASPTIARRRPSLATLFPLRVPSHGAPAPWWGKGNTSWVVDR
eukprot:15470762-Alexandrium_andersonii.AAC.1